ncbi:MAG: GNAT family N-acetyltransferase [Pseudomonadota bacterium]
MTEIRMETNLASFVMTEDGERCVLDFSLEDAVMNVRSVRVPKAVGGRGIAGNLTRHALDWARAQSLTVIPTCPYVARWIEKNSDYQNLIAA